MLTAKALPLLILVSLALVAVFVPEAPPRLAGGPIDSGDTAGCSRPRAWCC